MHTNMCLDFTKSCNYVKKKKKNRIFVAQKGQLKNLGVDGRMTSKWILKKKDGGYVDSINSGHDREKWWAVVYTDMNIRVPSNRENLFST